VALNRLIAMYWNIVTRLGELEQVYFFNSSLNLDAFLFRLSHRTWPIAQAKWKPNSCWHAHGRSFALQQLWLHLYPSGQSQFTVLFPQVKTSGVVRWRQTNFTILLFHNIILRLRPHYARENWKRNNHRSFWICVWGKLRPENYTIIVTSPF